MNPNLTLGFILNMRQFLLDQYGYEGNHPDGLIISPDAQDIWDELHNFLDTFLQQFPHLDITYID